ncbi:MAG: hypothetical protein K0R08_1301 [Solimicrobium sp.]|jgi:hypothetical protein|nr:hypothetical protein [Solimicrobium sp.]
MKNILTTEQFDRWFSTLRDKAPSDVFRRALTEPNKAILVTVLQWAKVFRGNARSSWPRLPYLFYAAGNGASDSAGGWK